MPVEGGGGSGRAAAAVVDASALAALLFGEPSGRDVVDRLEGRRLFAPTLLRYELASVALKKAKRRPELLDRLREALGLFTRMSVREVQVSSEAAWSLAEETGLTAYDAAYLDLARMLGAELVTLDARLDEASRE